MHGFALAAVVPSCRRDPLGVLAVADRHLLHDLAPPPAAPSCGRRMGKTVSLSELSSLLPSSSAGSSQHWSQSMQSLFLYSMNDLDLSFLRGLKEVEALAIVLQAEENLNPQRESQLPCLAGSQGWGCRHPSDKCFRVFQIGYSLRQSNS